MRRTVHLFLAGLALMFPTTGTAQMDGHGPDAWQVIGVAPDDVLNARSGPGTDHIVIGTFPPDATGLQMVTCVPYFTMAQFQALTEDQRARLPARWCLVHSRDGDTSGWVAGRYLAEDTSQAMDSPDPLIDEAIALVRRLYASAQITQGVALSPLHPSAAREFFFADVVRELAEGYGADPLFGAQDAQITGLDIRPAPGEAMFRGMITVHVDFRNFGQPQRAVVRLRVDPSLDPPAPRIMRIEHEAWAFP
ncbi:SH3 domain-containing protein [Sinisalibacter lacisalsi]|uniref:SH3 domain-containing protein n=1 Tax=Sinisalibacter lacisalsi TaxID=1526570 RepID=A0ABQ1QJR4_9RHOB|nr:SH3 domain-containing protein [Sinisalibacter lacisalsi]GGD27916.1 hypothetical protein GCM10011358_10170 [Sinisalibacter lacisalsi]